MMLPAGTRRRGAVLFITFLLMLVLAGLALAVGVASHNSLSGGRGQLHDKQAAMIAEAGWQRARQALVAATWAAATSPGNTYTESFGSGEYSVTIVDNGNSTYTITSSGYVPSQASAVAQRRVVETSVPLTISSNLSLAATPTASSSQASHPATDATDNSTSTFWRADTQGSGEWLRLDYGSATAVNQLVIAERQNITALSAVQYSSDASSWTAVPSLSVSTSGSGDNQTYTANFTATSARYFRVTFTSVASNQRVAVDELRSYGIAAFGTGTFSTLW